VPSNRINSAPASAASWRDVLLIHPAADLFPLMGDEELAELGEDIRKYGLREPITVVRQYRRRANGKIDVREYDLVLLDGRNRLIAMERAGFALVQDGKLDKTLGHKALGLEPLTGGGYAEAEDVDPYAFVISANLHRRHLTPEQRRGLIAAVLKANPEKPDRQIAVQVKADHKTVGSVRREQEDVGNIPHVETRTDTKGRKQPTRKPPVKRVYTPAMHRVAKLGADNIEKLKGTSLAGAREQDELVMLNRGAAEGELTPIVKRLIADACAGKDVSAIALVKNGVPPPCDDIGPNSPGENACKDARIKELENQVRRLEHENASKDARIGELENQVRRLTRENASKDARIGELENQVRRLTRENKELRVCLPPGDQGPLPALLDRTQS
jgi:hypothetical protein